MTQTTNDTAHDVCIMLMQGCSPDYLFQAGEKNGIRIDPAAIEAGIELAIKKLRRRASATLTAPQSLSASSKNAGCARCKRTFCAS